MWWAELIDSHEVNSICFEIHVKWYKYFSAFITYHMLEKSGLLQKRIVKVDALEFCSKTYSHEVNYTCFDIYTWNNTKTWCVDHVLPYVTGKKCFVQKRIVKAGVLFQDACTLILLSLSGGPNGDYLFVNLDFNGTICR